MSEATTLTGFAPLLRSWRRNRRRSQLDLAMTSGVSQRHISFLESGRARPSRSMILLLSEALEVPLRERNQWLLAGGFAPIFQARPFADPQMSQVFSAVKMMLANHEPYPAAAVDREWNIRMSNAPFDGLNLLLGEDLWARVGGEHRNLMRFFFHPQGLRPFVANWAVAAPLLWRRAHREAEAFGGDEMKRVLAELAPHQDWDTLRAADHTALVPVLPLEISKDGWHLSLFTVIATFGTPQDVTADELRIESLFPADEATERFFRSAPPA